MNLHEFYNGKRVLVTGATGFKGSWLSIWLRELGAEVIGFGLPPKTENDNYVICGLDTKTETMCGDIRFIQDINTAITENQPDIIFHLAAQALTLDSYTLPRVTVDTNVMGTTNVLESIRRSGSVKAAVMITSDKCYENCERDVPYTEDDRLGGKDLYSASKAAAEIIISAYRRSFFNQEHSPAIASARAGNVIGGGDWSENRLVPDCIRALQHHQLITIRNPRSVRPWQYVLEPLYGYLLLGMNLYTKGHSYAEPWNFAPVLTKEDTVEQVVKLVIGNWGSGEYMIQKDEGAKECGMLLLDSTKSNTRLGWRSVLPLSESIRLTVEDYRLSGLTKGQVYQQRVSHIKEYEGLCHG